MAHPKRKQSKARTAKRRTHYTAEVPTVSFDQTTGQPHLRHHAHWYDGKLYYKGEVISEKMAEA